MLPGLSDTVAISSILSISIVSCFYFFFRYFTASSKTLGLRMIVILSLADLIFHISFLTGIWADTTPEREEILVIILRSAVRFAIIWVSCIAFVIFKFLRDDGVEGSERASRRLLISLIIVTTIVGLG